VASLRGESSNQLFETLEEWNEYLQRIPAVSGTAIIIIEDRGENCEAFPGSFGLYLDEPRRQPSR
jgi:hypothetical protein